MEPELGMSNKPSACNSVLFPEPEAPITATNSPLAMPKLTSHNTSILVFPSS
jgi:hypothetical protein